MGSETRDLRAQFSHGSKRYVAVGEVTKYASGAVEVDVNLIENERGVEVDMIECDRDVGLEDAAVLALIEAWR